MVQKSIMSLSNYLTIDVEDYFQVSAFENIVPKGKWENYPSRVVENTRRILQILRKNEVKATFFTLGWIAQNFPHLIKEISADGHELGCHSYYHRLVYNLTPEEFLEDTRMAKDTLEQIIGKPVIGYRAPSYSITRKSLWALQILKELGFTYDSSIFPIYHDRYGIPEAPRFPFVWDLSQTTPRVSKRKINDVDIKFENSITEFPISTSLFLGRKIPISGGGYFRIFPYWFTNLALKKINEKEGKKFIFYVHPWEFDPQQPRFDSASILSKFRHYKNLNKTTKRFDKLTQSFSFRAISSRQS